MSQADLVRTKSTRQSSLVYQMLMPQKHKCRHMSIHPAPRSSICNASTGASAPEPCARGETVKGTPVGLLTFELLAICHDCQWSSQRSQCVCKALKGKPKKGILVEHGGHSATDQWLLQSFDQTQCPGSGLWKAGHVFPSSERKRVFKPQMGSASS